MSAREKIVGLFRAKALGKAVADEVLDEYAHELAEKLRKHADSMVNREWATGVLIAADLTDPNVK